MALTAGALNVSASVNVTGATIAPQGTASSNSLSSPTANASGSGGQSTVFGTTNAGECDILCAGEFTLASAATLTLDLYVGTDFKNLFGQTAAFRKLRSIVVAISSGGDAAGLRIGNAASVPCGLFFGAVTQTWTIFPSGPPFLGGSPAGVTLTTMAKNLMIENTSAVSITFKLFLAGTSA